MVEPEGKIFGQKCVDIVIRYNCEDHVYTAKSNFLCRHVAVSPQTCETTDKFRIHMFEEGSSEVNCDLL